MTKDENSASEIDETGERFCHLQHNGQDCEESSNGMAELWRISQRDENKGIIIS